MTQILDRDLLSGMSAGANVTTHLSNLGASWQQVTALSPFIATTTFTGLAPGTGVRQAINPGQIVSSAIHGVPKSSTAYDVRGDVRLFQSHPNATRYFLLGCRMQPTGIGYFARLHSNPGGTFSLDLFRLASSPTISYSGSALYTGATIALPTVSGSAYLGPYRLWIATRGTAQHVLYSIDGGNTYNYVGGAGDSSTQLIGPGQAGIRQVGIASDLTDQDAQFALTDLSTWSADPGFVLSHNQIEPGLSYTIHAIGNGTGWTASTQFTLIPGTGPGGATVSGGTFTQTAPDAVLQHAPLTLNAGTVTGTGPVPLVISDGVYSATLWVANSASTLSVLAAPTSMQVPALLKGAAVAYVLNDATNSGVTWSVSPATNAGTIDQNGIYTAPAIQGGAATIKAISAHDGVTESDIAVSVIAGLTPYVEISPLATQVTAGKQALFTAYAVNLASTTCQFRAALGTIDAATGLYTAPASAQVTIDTVTAAATANTVITAAATVTVTPAVSVQITGPGGVLPTTLEAGQSVQLTATVVNATTNANVVWTATGGTLDQTGFFTAPSLAGTYFITAQSLQDPTVSATVAIAVYLPSPPSVVLVTSAGSDLVYLEGAVTVGGNPTAGYQLLTGATAGGESVVAATLPPPASFPAAFAPQPTAAVGTRKYYVVRGYDGATPPNYGDRSNEVYSATSAQTPTGRTYTRACSAAYGPANSGIASTLGYTVYDSIGARLARVAPAAVEVDGQGTYLFTVLLDAAYSGTVVLDAPSGSAPVAIDFSADEHVLLELATANGTETLTGGQFGAGTLTLTDKAGTHTIAAWDLARDSAGNVTQRVRTV